VNDQPKPCIWFCPRHGALPEGTRLCGQCGTEQGAYVAALPGQLTLDLPDEAA
jgi:hypothetical protein